MITNIHILYKLQLIIINIMINLRYNLTYLHNIHVTIFKFVRVNQLYF